MFYQVFIRGVVVVVVVHAESILQISLRNAAEFIVLERLKFRLHFG